MSKTFIQGYDTRSRHVLSVRCLENKRAVLASKVRDELAATHVSHGLKPRSRA